MRSLVLNFVLILISCAFCSAKSSLRFLNENNWEDVLKGEWMIEFYAPWCPACKALDPVWHEFASWSDDLGIRVGQIDVTESPGLSGRFMITALPTIYHVKDGEFRQYRGSRDRDEFLSFVEEHKWKTIDTVSWWRSPASVQMSAVSGVFRLSMVLRNWHTQLTEDYGLPYWASYIIFGAATIILGTVLALIFVFVIDCLCPPRSVSKSHVGDAKDKENDTRETDDEDLFDEENSQLSSAIQTEEEEEKESNRASNEENGRESDAEKVNEIKTASPVRQRRPRRAE